jgi:hypothetical protein
LIYNGELADFSFISYSVCAGAYSKEKKIAWSIAEFKETIQECRKQAAAIYRVQNNIDKVQAAKDAKSAVPVWVPDKILKDRDLFLALDVCIKNLAKQVIDFKVPPLCHA